jgi:hypothetical protein
MFVQMTQDLFLSRSSSDGRLAESVYECCLTPPKANMGRKKPDLWMTSNIESLESFKKNFSDALKAALDEGRDKEAEVFRACISQVQAQIDELKV